MYLWHVIIYTYIILCHIYYNIICVTICARESIKNVQTEKYDFFIWIFILRTGYPRGLHNVQYTYIIIVMFSRQAKIKMRRVLGSEWGPRVPSDGERVMCNCVRREKIYIIILLLLRAHTTNTHDRPALSSYQH